jgi:signal transduction histidine kinase
LTCIDQAEELDKKNQQLEEKNRELNNLVAMFAHNFLGTLQCIRSNAEHDNNPTIHLKTVKMMGGALTAFSILSADDDKLVEQLKQDNTGEMNLQQNLANNLALAISQLLGKTNKDKIVNLYLQHLSKTKQIETETTSEELRINRDYRKMWQALQHQWEDDFNALFSENVDLPLLQKWITVNFCPVEITGFDSYNISFREYGITDSIFLIVFMEIFVNAFKYMDVNKNEPLILKLCEENQFY